MLYFTLDHHKQTESCAGAGTVLRFGRAAHACIQRKENNSMEEKNQPRRLQRSLLGSKSGNFR